MKTSLTVLLGGALVAAAFMIPTSDANASGGKATGRMFSVKITNLTREQIFSPPMVTTHRDDVTLFRAGEPASAELQELAENGNNVMLRDKLVSDELACDVLGAVDPIMPGASATYMVGSTKGARLVSAVGMLVSTNDSFFALDSMELPRKRHAAVRYLIPAWDAGTEVNSEDCAFVPGPPCGAGAVHDPAEAEGFVHISSGIHGNAGVSRETYDWNNPVALVTIERL
jgi:hypothetical protein